MSLVCLPKHAKLLKASDYNQVFDKAVRSSDRYFTVLAVWAWHLLKKG